MAEFIPFMERPECKHCMVATMVEQYKRHKMDARVTCKIRCGKRDKKEDVQDAPG